MGYSACGQDLWVLQTLANKTNGFFVDLGAGNGITYNNTYLLEKDYAWDGICVENTEVHYSALTVNRICDKVQITVNKMDGKCYIDEEGKITETGTTLVECLTFDTIMRNNGYAGTIDYLSVNVGNSQRQVLESIDFSRYDITLISVQNNIYRSNFIGSDDDVFPLLKEAGYERMQFNVASHLEGFPKIHQPIEDFYFKMPCLYPELYP